MNRNDQWAAENLPRKAGQPSVENPRTFHGEFADFPRKNLTHPETRKTTNSICLTDLALRYFPRSTKRSASEQLRRWMRLNPDLQRRLAELHFQPRQRVLTPLQHEAVLRYLGEPGE